MATARDQITEIANVANIRQGVEQAQALMESMQRQLTALRQRNTELETELSLIEEDRDTALELLLWPFLSQHETPDQVLSYLDEHGLNPRKPEHAGEIAAFLESRAEFTSNVTELMEGED